ncbi:MAG: flagellar basal body-associated protein FliL [Kineosporiaceae bacterium]
MASTTAPPKAGATDGGEADGGGPRKKKRRPPVLVVVAAVVLLLGLGGGGYWWFGMRTPPPPPPPKPGEVLALEPISLNLAEGHYLKLGIALQFEYSAEKKVKYDGSKALDYAIQTFSGRTMAELSDPAQREALKEELEHHVVDAYAEKTPVLDLYLTEFVMQ